jgi:starch synthase
VKIVLSLADDKFEGTLAENFKQKLEGEGVMDSNMNILEIPSYENLYRFVIDYADGVIATSANVDASLLEYARSQGKKVLEYSDADAKEVFDNYKRFYDEL